MLILKTGWIISESTGNHKTAYNLVNKYPLNSFILDAENEQQLRAKINRNIDMMFDSFYNRGVFAGHYPDGALKTPKDKTHPNTTLFK